MPTPTKRPKAHARTSVRSGKGRSLRGRDVHPQIPAGPYCHGLDGKAAPCPYWDLKPGKPRQLNGWCHYHKGGDWNGSMALFDQVKDCGTNEYGGQSHLLLAIRAATRPRRSRSRSLQRSGA